MNIKNSLSLFALIALYGCTNPEKTNDIQPLSKEKTVAEKKLEKRNVEFKKEIISITDNVYTAVGYDVSNISMVVGKDGYILIDGGSNPRSAKAIKAEFAKITSLPLKAIIVTHGHGDHAKGVPNYVEGKEIEIWAMKNFGHEGQFSAKAGVNFPQRPLRQAGFALPKELRINNGVAPAMYLVKPAAKESGAKKEKEAKTVYASNLKPTKFLDGPSKKIRIAGIDIELHHAPGETDDQLFVWLPKEKVVFSGDNFYKSWPNLYAIRGTEYRDVNDWINSLSAMIAKDAHHLVGGHTRPIIGKEKVKEILTTFRDAVQYVFEKTVEGINQGMTPDELVDYVQLPERFSSQDYLHGYYGRVDWSVRQIFNGYMGWFDGNATNLIPLSSKEEAHKTVALMGGVTKLEAEILTTLKKQEFQWAAKLVDYLLVLNPDNDTYKILKAHAMEGLGRSIDNAVARNYYLTVAQELRKQTE